MEPITNFFGMCTSINDTNCNYKPCKSFIVQNHLLIYGKKHREKIRNTGKTQGILSRLECGHPIIVRRFWLVHSKLLLKECGMNFALKTMNLFFTRR